MEITSEAFNNGDRIPKKYTCEGPNISPPLQFSNIPEGTKSLVLMIEDPDAEAKPWVHWMVFNIPPDAKGFAEEVDLVESFRLLGFDAAGVLCQILSISNEEDL